MADPAVDPDRHAEVEMASQMDIFFDAAYLRGGRE